MKAVGYRSPGGIDRASSLIEFEAPAPVLRPHDLLVRIHAVSVNPVDTKIRRTREPIDAGPRILGWDAAGVVEKTGDAVTLFAVGDEVFYAGDVNRHGSNAELQAVDERIVGHKPASLGWTEAAALPLTAITAWELLFDRLRVPYGQGGGQGKLLIVNGAGGVGSILIQLARRLTGLSVIATASRPETREWVRSMGAHHVIDHRKPLDEQLSAAGLGEVDYVASLSGSGQNVGMFPTIIKPQGALAMTDDPSSFDIVGFKRKAITISWEAMFARSTYQTPDMAEQHMLLEEASRLIDAGVLRTTIGCNLGPISADMLKRAHLLVESGNAIGKTVLEGF